ncbi:MAG: YegS/Rv2252/BmrU family lipid kinase [Ferruginibacter sp.]
MLKQRKFLVFINPVSGTKSKAGTRMLVEKVLTENHFKFEVLPAERSGKYDFLKEKIAKDKITDIIICGGDGTVNQITAYLQGTGINAGIIPMGSGNGLAFAAGIPKDPGRALDIILTGKSDYIDAFTINNKFSCMLCGLGFDAQVAHDFAKQPARGITTYITQTLKHFFVAVPYPFVIKANGVTVKTEAFFISIANSNQFGNHFTIAPKASLSDGLLDIVIVNKTGKLNLILKILKQVRNGIVSPVDDPKQTVQYFQTKKMVISNPGLAPLHIDGEPAKTAVRFEIEIIEKAFRLLQP